MVFVNITSPWAENDVTMTISILPCDFFSCCFIFPPNIALTKNPKEDIFPPFFPGIGMHWGIISKDSERAIIGHPRYSVCPRGPSCQQTVKMAKNWIFTQMAGKCTVIFFYTKVTKSHILYTVTLLSTRGFISSVTQHHSPSFLDLRNFNFKKIPLPLGAASGCMASFYRQNLSDLLCFSCTFPICQSVQ